MSSRMMGPSDGTVVARIICTNAKPLLVEVRSRPTASDTPILWARSLWLYRARDVGARYIRTTEDVRGFDLESEGFEGEHMEVNCPGCGHPHRLDVSALREVARKGLHSPAALEATVNDVLYSK